jgi:two-component system NtrC family sensor kinase
MRTGLFGKIFLLFAVMVVALGGVAAWVGVRSVTGAVYHEAQARVTYDLRIARLLLDDEIKRVESAIAAIPEKPRLLQLTPGEAHTTMELDLGPLGLDYLSLVKANGEVIALTGDESLTTPAGPNLLEDPIVRDAIQRKQAVGGVAILSRERLLQHGAALARQAHMVFEPTPLARPTPETELTGGMALHAAIPIRRADGEVIGVLVGGVLLNRNYAIVDRVKELVFGDEKHGGKDIGTVTVFQWDVRISTNVLKQDGQRAIQTRVSKEVYDRVLEQGLPYYDRAFVVNDWYLTAYEPLRDIDQKVVGMLYVGVLEAKFSAMRTALLTRFMALTGVAVLIALIASGFLARAFTGPLRHLAEASHMIGQGRLNWRVEEPSSHDEVRDLSRAFNQMGEAIEAQQRALEEVNARLNAQNQQLERLNRNYMEMLGFVSHELKGPLSSSVMSANALRQEIVGPLTETQKRCAAIICRNLDYATAMIQNYLDLSRIEKNELRINRARFPVAERVIQPVLQDLEPAILNKKTQVEVDVPPEVEIDADRDLMRIVFQNLIGNAVKYGRAEGKVRVWVKDAGEQWEFHVWNQGVGVPEEKRDQLFTKFGRIQDPRLTAEKGTGLGLFITRDILLRHGSEIAVQGEDGHWIDFLFTLPKAPAA